MAGDPRQLGAIIRSKLASAAGLGESFLERIMARHAEPRLIAAYTRLALALGAETNPNDDEASPLCGLRCFELPRLANWVPDFAARSVVERFCEQGFAWHAAQRSCAHTAGQPAAGTPAHVRSASLRPSRDAMEIIEQRMSQITLGTPEPEPAPELRHSVPGTVCEESEPSSGAPRYDWRVCVKLLQNYRSHPALLKLPSQLFYNDELRPMADRALTHCMADWEELPAPGFPLVSTTVGSRICLGSTQSVDVIL